jgi:hypothetical protein
MASAIAPVPTIAMVASFSGDTLASIGGAAG